MVWPALASANIYWANFLTNGIGSDTLDGNAANRTQTFISTADTKNPAGVADDGKYLYWTNFADNTIGRAALDGSSPPDPNFITTHTNGPEAVAVSRGFIYWTNRNAGTISRDTIDGNAANVADIVSGQTDPCALAVDSSHVFWSNGDSGGSTIGRANLDGGSANGSFITGQSGPFGIVLTGGFIYWANFTAGTIVRDTIDGNPANIATIVSGLADPLGLAIVGNQMYWSQENSAAIGTATITGQNVNPSFIPTGNAPFHLAVDLPPSNDTPPGITGSAVVGQTLTAANGTWEGNPTTFSHEWLRCDGSGSGCAVIPGAAGQSYVLTPADAASTIRVQEIASNPRGGVSDPGLSAPTGAVQNPPTPTPTPTPILTPAPPPPASLALGGTSASGSVASLTLTCHGVAGQACAGNVSGTIQEHKRAGVLIAVTASKKHHGKP
ncbi:MAG: hypothetical protein JO280_11005, partial [Mycobacteriaceae bacterium]|nr:hypothetical protein [Mycobacteriaceae bacterium]